MPDLLTMNTELQDRLMVAMDEAETLGRAVAVRDEMIETLREDVANLERDLRGKRAQNRRLRAEQDEKTRNDPLYPQAIEVLQHWKAVCSPKARELGGKRLENVLARLRGKHTVEELKRCAEGYALKPYVVGGKRSPIGPKDDWHADAELIYRDAKKVAAGIAIADQADDLRSVMKPTVAPGAGSGVDVSVGELGTAALRFAKHGWAVFPVRAREKAPATRNGLLDACTDAHRINAAWRSHPDLNVGIRCGKESGIVVLDIDGEDGWDSLHRLEDHYGELPETASVKTPSGGQHYYFAHPGVEIRNTTGFPAAGLDVRGDGGYVLAPPSVHPNGSRYEIDDEVGVAQMPQWLVDALVKRQSDERSKVGPNRDWAKFISDGANAGQRDDRMTQFVGREIALGRSPGEVLELARALNGNVKPPLTERDLNRIVASIARSEARKAAA